MPNWVTNIIEVEGDMIQEMLYKVKSDKCDFDFEKIIPMPESEKNNWYDWRVKNWGTKWNINEVDINNNIISFNTAWSTPFMLLLELSNQFPSLSFIIKYADEDVGSNCGMYKLQNGSLLEEYEGDTVFACEILGLDPADYDSAYHRDQTIDNVLKNE